MTKNYRWKLATSFVSINLLLT